MTTLKRKLETADIQPDSDDARNVEGSFGSNHTNSNNEHNTQKGDNYKHKHSKAIRICALNVGRLPLSKENEKNRDLFQWMRELKADIILLSELGINWRNMNNTNNWYARTKEEFQRISAVTAHNTHERSKNQMQWGGTAIVATNNTASRVIQKGTDTSGLGRWAWIRLQGREERKIRCVSIYSPSKYSRGPLSVWQQHHTIQSTSGDELEPTEALIRDLRTAIGKWKNEGDSIIIGGDINQNIVNSPLQKMLEEQGFDETIHSKLDEPTETHIWNNKRVAIDSIWCSQGLHTSNSGYSDYFRWDHRTAWCDIPGDFIFGNDRLPTSAFKGRRLLLERPMTTKKYSLEYTKLFRQLKIGERIEILSNEIAESTSITKNQIKLIEEIDKDRTNAMLTAERKCRKIKTTQVPFSPRLNTAAKAMQFWNLLSDKMKGKRINSRYLARVKKQARISKLKDNVNFDITIQEAQKARKRYLRLKRSAVLHRKSFLEERAAEAATMGNTSLEKAIKAIREREKMRDIFKRIRSALGKSITGGGLSLVSRKEGNQNKTFTAERDIVECCMSENVSKYSQAHGSRLCNNLAIRKFGRFGTNKLVANAISNRNLHLFDHATREFIEAIKTDEPIPEWNAEMNSITIKDHINGWRKQNEKTASGPSGLHFGMWKANCRSSELAKADASLRNISLRTGYVLERWKKGVDVELLKEEGNFNVKKLRTICLFEADHNQNNKYIGKTAIQHAEKVGGISQEQFGSRKGKRAIEVSLNNRLTDDIMRMYAIRGAICSNDAKSCYDRISHIALSMCLQRMGVPTKAIEGMLQTIQEMRHHIKTAFGISELYYGSSRNRVPLQGIPQGHGAAPTGWALLSTPVIEAMRTKNLGFKFATPIGRKPINFVCFSFVDDTDLVHTLNYDEGHEAMQEVISTWSRNLATTGGAIVPEKSYWYPVDFKWRQGEWKYKTRNEFDIEMYIPDPLTGEDKSLDKLDITEARKALGVMVRHDGVQKDSAEFLRQKAAKWAKCVNSRTLDPEEARLALKTTIWRTLCYPLAATTMSEKECNHAISPALTAALPVIGLQRKISRTLLHGATQDMGLGFPNLYHEQLSSHLEMIVNHWRADTMTSRLLHAATEAVWIESGDSNWWKDSNELWSKLIRNNWIVETCKQAISMDMQLEPPSCLKPQRIHDQLIMEEVCKWTDDIKLIRAINNCRKHLNVLWLSDLVDQDGKTWLDGIWVGERNSPTSSNLIWPPVGMIHKRTWNKWKLAMNQIFAKADQSDTISSPLGEWINLENVSTSYVYTPDDDRMYSAEGHSWRMWTRSPSRTRINRYIPGEICTIPDKYHMANAYRKGEYLIMKSHMQVKKQQTKQDNYEDGCRQADKHECWAIERSRIMGDRTALKATLERGEGIIVCDGSVKLEKGVAAFTIQAEDASDRNALRGVSITPPTNSIQSQRAELAGLFSALTALKIFCSCENAHVSTIKVACDNLSALRVFDSKFKVKAKEPDADLYTATLQLKKCLGIEFNAIHVKGHQDEDTLYESLNDVAKLNVMMDTLAKEFGTIVEKDNLKCNTDGRILGEHWRLWRGNNKLTQYDTKSISRLIYQQEIRGIWEKRKKIGHNSISIIDWKAMGKTFGRLNSRQQISTMKLISGEYGTNSRLAQRSQQLETSCPRCGEKEDTNHLWVCQSISSQQIWSDEITKLERELRHFPTERKLLKIIVTNMKKSVRDLPPYTDAAFGSKHHRAFQEQTKLGWDAMLKGFLHVNWRSIQENFLKQTKSKKDVDQWLCKLIRRIWQIAWMQWDDRNQIKNERTTTDNQRDSLITKTISYVEDKLRQDQFKHLDNIDKRRLDNTHQLKAWVNHMTKRLAITDEEMELTMSKAEWKVIEQWRLS